MAKILRSVKFSCFGGMLTKLCCKEVEFSAAVRKNKEEFMCTDMERCVIQ